MLGFGFGRVEVADEVDQLVLFGLGAVGLGNTLLALCFALVTEFVVKVLAMVPFVLEVLLVLAFVASVDIGKAVGGVRSFQEFSCSLLIVFDGCPKVVVEGVQVFRAAALRDVGGSVGQGAVVVLSVVEVGG